MTEQAGRVEVTGLSKRFGAVQAVDDVTFTAEPGRVTGFLGPNGSGKTTTLSMMLGLVRPDAGTATIGGAPYTALDRPALTVGASLSASFHPAHTGRAHLDIVRRGIGLPRATVDEKLEFVGLAAAADRRTGGYSLGMKQRLALAAALLGDPEVLLLDEPINGLDPEGIRWIRQFLGRLAEQGKTVMLSSHLLSEVQQTVDDVLVIREGKLVYSGTLQQLQAGSGERAVLVSAPDQPRLAELLQSEGAAVHGVRGDAMRVTGSTPGRVGEIALAAGIPLSHLSVEESQLEQSFLALIDGADGPTTSGPTTSGPTVSSAEAGTATPGDLTAERSAS